MKKTFLVLALGIFSLPSCNKEKIEPTPPPIQSVETVTSSLSSQEVNLKDEKLGTPQEEKNLSSFDKLNNWNSSAVWENWGVGTTRSQTYTITTAGWLNSINVPFNAVNLPIGSNVGAISYKIRVRVMNSTFTSTLSDWNHTFTQSIGAYNNRELNSGLSGKTVAVGNKVVVELTLISKATSQALQLPRSATGTNPYSGGTSKNAIYGTNMVTRDYKIPIYVTI